ncbi:MAG TPA: glutathione peroxidase [Gammaproteobacteria bacterium]
MIKTILAMLMVMISANSYAKECSSMLDFNVRTLNEDAMVNLCEEYQGKVILIVNTASKCAYTDQYGELEKLYSQYKDAGLVVLGFPSNDFGQQEPGNEQQIKSFCRLTYGVKFPMFAKSHVAERNADSIYIALAKASGRYPQWNFHKYLIGRNGELVADYSSAINPMSEAILKEIKSQLVKF